MPSAEFSWSSNHWGQIQSSLNCFIQDFLIARGTSANSMTWLTSDWKPSNESFLQGFLSKSGSRITNAKAVNPLLWFADSCTFFSCEFLHPEREQASFMPDLRPPYPLWLCPVSDERVSVLNLPYPLNSETGALGFHSRLSRSKAKRAKPSKQGPICQRREPRQAQVIRDKRRSYPNKPG